MIVKSWIKSSIKHLIWKISPSFFKKRVTYSGQVFAIGIYSGENPFSICCVDESLNPVITAADVKDVPAAFVADPFLMKKDKKWYMFFEVFNKINRRGEIGVATSDDAATWRYKKIVLKAPYHLSYPHVFRWNDQFFMIPESSLKGVGLYQAQQFPYRWKYTKTLIDRKGLVDSTIFFSADTWWLFTSQIGNGLDDQTLRLYFADAPNGNWAEHPQSPMKVDKKNLTRCGGRVIRYNNKLIRFAQNSLPAYGTDVRAFEVVKLSRQEYREKEMRVKPILHGSGQLWNRGGMHHIDAQCIEDGTWIASVDGWYFNRKNNHGCREAAQTDKPQSRSDGINGSA